MYCNHFPEIHDNHPPVSMIFVNLEKRVLHTSLRCVIAAEYLCLNILLNQ